MRKESAESVSVHLPTSGQRLIYLMERLRGGNGMMGVPLLYRIRGGLAVPDLQEALCDLVRRHAALRTTFVVADHSLKQVVHPAGAASLQLSSTDTTAAPDPAAAAYEQARDFLRADIDLAVSPVRAALWRIADDDWLLVLNPHHIVTDAWSNMIIARDLAALYRARTQRRTADLPTIGWQYADYAAWRRETANGDLAGSDREYLLNVLRGARFPVLPPAPERARRQRPLAGNEWFRLGAGQLTALQAVARHEQTTLYVVLVSLFLAALREVTGQPDIAIGSILGNRARREVRETVGFFANMVVVRAETGSCSTVHEVIRAVRASSADGLPHEELSHLSLSSEDWPQDVVGRPEDVVFHLLAEPPTAPVDEGFDFGGLHVRPDHVPDGLGCRFELEMLLIPRPGGLEGVVRYAADRFTAKYARTLVNKYLAAAARVSVRLNRLSRRRDNRSAA